MQDEQKITSNKKDFWDKINAIGIPFVVALITVVGSIFLNLRQEEASKNSMYTQLMSEQKKTENEIRKDMFKTILNSFLDDNDRNITECVMDKIDRQLLELEMISRNFHETMDINPLFRHLLQNIVRNIKINYSIANKNINDLTSLTRNDCDYKFFYREFSKKDFKNKSEEEKKKIIEKRIEKIKERKLNKLNYIAQRITIKQLESLTDVAKRARLNINFSETCEDISPAKLSDNDNCDKKGIETKPVELAINDNGETTKRTFKISCNRSYKRWNQILIKVVTNRLESEIQADPEGGNENVREFWLDFFDFPLIDNTYLSSKERYAVVLDSIDDNKAQVSLLYFPASYAGFKEKSYYQNQIINKLLQKAIPNK